MAAQPDRWDLEVDVVAIGSGLGGITAAIVAHDRGKRVCVLEKAPRMGGLSGYGGGEVYCPNGRHMAEIGVEDSDEATRAYFDFLAAGFNHPELTDKLVASYRSAIDYLETDLDGLPWPLDPAATDYETRIRDMVGFMLSLPRWQFQ